MRASCAGLFAQGRTSIPASRGRSCFRNTTRPLPSTRP